MNVNYIFWNKCSQEERLERNILTQLASTLINSLINSGRFCSVFTVDLALPPEINMGIHIRMNLYS